jgi:YebC/PmpR family DNA-binding regulatory protein
MSGHSKWATTKRAKAVVDSKRSAVFTKIARVITVAAREKGGDPVMNFSLRMAIDKAKAANMPKENIERSIKRGTGELAGETIEEIYYEGIGPAKTQFILKVLTDNKNRSAGNIRHLFTKHGGALSPVMWNFVEKGVVRVSAESLKEKGIKQDELELELIDAGADDIQAEAEGLTVLSRREDLSAVKKFFDDKGVITESADIEYVAKEKAAVAEVDREGLEKFIDALDEDEDVAEYYTNAEI